MTGDGARSRRSPDVGPAALFLTLVVAVPGCTSRHAVPSEVEQLLATCTSSERGAADRCAGWLYEQLLLALVDEYTELGLTEYVNSVGRNLARASGRPDLRVRVRILDDPRAQAYALPGGNVYITRGLLAHLSSEAELAAVLGHEIGHLAAAHASVEGNDLPDVEPPALWGRRASYEHERDEERLADALAVQYLVRLGYDPRAMATMLAADHRAAEAELAEARQVAAAAAAEEGAAAPDVEENAPDLWGRTHPHMAARIALILRIIDGRDEGRLERESFLRQLDGMVVGHDPRRGVQEVEGRLVHPEAGLSYELPQGWMRPRGSTRNGQAGWFVAELPNEQMLFFFLQLGSPRSRALEQAMLDEIRQSPSSELTVAGRPAVIGRAQTGPDGWLRLRGTAFRSPAAVIHGDERSYGVLLVAQDECTGCPVQEQFESILRTLRDEPAAGLPELAPTRLRLVEVARDQTLEEFVTTVCRRPDDLELIARLNNRFPDSRLEAGELVKCLVESAAVAPP